MVGGLQSKNASSGNMMCSRIIYGTLLAVAAVVALLMKYFANNVVLDLPMFKFGCVDNTIEVSSLEESITVVCGGNQAVYRICFGAGVFFLIMMIGAPISPSFHNGCWVAKIVLFPLLIAACFFIPNEFFHGYYVTAVVFAAIFLVLQVLLLIDFSYRIHECIIKRMDQVDDNNESAEEGKGSCNMWKPIYLGFCVMYLRLYRCHSCNVHSFPMSSWIWHDLFDSIHRDHHHHFVIGREIPLWFIAGCERCYLHGI